MRDILGFEDDRAIHWLELIFAVMAAVGLLSALVGGTGTPPRAPLRTGHVDEVGGAPLAKVAKAPRVPEGK